MPPGLWELINVPLSGCVRAKGLNFFEDKVYKTSAYTKPQPCYSGCDPTFSISTAPYEKLKKSPDQDLLKRYWYISKLREWRQKKAASIFPDSYIQHFPTLVLPDDILGSLAGWAEYIHDESTMWWWVSSALAGLPLYYNEILEILNKGRGMRGDDSEIYKLWKEQTDRKKGRVSAPVVNTRPCLQVAINKPKSSRVLWVIILDLKLLPVYILDYLNIIWYCAFILHNRFYREISCLLTFQLF